MSESQRPDDLGFALPKPAALGKTRAVALVLVALAVVAGAFVIGWAPKHHARDELAAATRADQHTVPRVEVITAKTVASDHAIQLPGTIQALEETVIHPRADGYVKRWLVDIGDTVTEGQSLVEIESPELDQQVAQARAQLAQAEAQVAQQKANVELSKINYDRDVDLVKDHLVAQSDVDQKRAQAQVDVANQNAAQANVAAQEANIRRLAQLLAYTKVIAPFAGKITARSVERGQLVSATSSLYTLAATDPVRVLVQVPQDVAPSVRADAAAEVRVREYAGIVFAGKVARAAGALDPSLRTMTTEVRVPNEQGQLLTGMYAQVALTLPSPHHVLEVPPTSIYNDAKGVRVAVVDDGGNIRFRKVVIERDTGSAIQLSSGLDGSERVIKIADASYQDGMQVEVVAPQPASGDKK